MVSNPENKVKTKCYSCGATLHVTRDTVSELGKEVYCQDCLIQADCRHCGRTIQTTHEKFATFDGRPVCKSCASGPVNPDAPAPDMDAGGVTGRRIIAALVDLAYPFVVATAFIVGMRALGVNDLAGLSVDLLSIGILLLMTVGNFVWDEAESGQTVGKKLTGLVVVKKDGSPVTLTSVIVRNLFRPVDLLGGYAVGFAFVSLTAENQRLGDYVARTVVVRVSDQ